MKSGAQDILDISNRTFSAQQNWLENLEKVHLLIVNSNSLSSRNGVIPRACVLLTSINNKTFHSELLSTILQGYRLYQRMTKKLPYWIRHFQNRMHEDHNTIHCTTGVGGVLCNFRTTRHLHISISSLLRCFLWAERAQSLYQVWRSVSMPGRVDDLSNKTWTGWRKLKLLLPYVVVFFRECNIRTLGKQYTETRMHGSTSRHFRHW